MNEEQHHINLIHKGVKYRFYGRSRWEYYSGEKWLPINGILIPAQVLSSAVHHPDFVPAPHDADSPT